VGVPHVLAHRRYFFSEISDDRVVQFVQRPGPLAHSVQYLRYHKVGGHGIVMFLVRLKRSLKLLQAAL
jgi:hypothetical protein